jgi:dimethylamine corrinoid protein
MNDFLEFKQAISDLDEVRVIQLTDMLLKSNPTNTDLEQVILAFQDGMGEIGNRFESGEYFLAELIFAGEIFQEIMNKVKPYLKGSKNKCIGKVLLGTVQGDLHDIGKNIVRDMLEGAGFEVRDLGVDVPIERFVEEIKEFEPQILGLSVLLNHAIDAMKKTVDAIKEAGLRDQIKIIIGGNPVSEQTCRFVGADAFSRSVAEGVEKCKKLVENTDGF